MKIIVWGIGNRTTTYLKNGYFNGCTILGYADSDKYGESYEGKIVWSPEELVEKIKEADFLIICNYFIGEIFSKCLELNINRKKILFTDSIEEAFVGESDKRLLKIIPALKQDLQMNRYKLIQMNEKDAIDIGREVGRGQFSNIVYMRDYFRYRSFEYLAELINEDEVAGSLAEFGVFRGEFSALINKKFPDRRLFLFDTFEGFEKNEIEYETEKGRCNDRFSDYFTHTSEERMLKNMPYPERVIVCKGFFPDSITKEAENENYAFVSIDVDFEKSMLNGLEFFYPRLSSGGVIFIHDYNSTFLGGVKRAVKQYEKKLGMKLKKIPLADRAGTLAIIK